VIIIKFVISFGNRNSAFYEWSKCRFKSGKGSSERRYTESIEKLTSNNIHCL